MIPALFDIRSVFRALQSIDETTPSYTRPPEQGARVALLVLFSSCICLLLLNYCKNSQPMELTFRQLALWQGIDPDFYSTFLREHHWGSLCRFVWWTFWHVLTFVLVPVFIIKVFLKESVRDFGWRWGETHKHWLGYLALLTPILGLIVVVASQREDFLDHYPFYKLAYRSWTDFLLWECLYLTQFVCLEFFFRGYLLHALRPYYGSAAIFIMLIPYVMIHFPKPWLEATGAIFFGLFLGILALRSKSIWGGFFVHAGVAIGMDIASLIQNGKVPSGW